MKNPCLSPVAKKLFHKPKAHQWIIFDKDIVDEAIFRTVDTRNRLMLELMARGGMRISEVLGLRPIDINDNKLLLHEPKSGREHEMIFILQKVADRLREYVETRNHQEQNIYR